MTINLFPHSSPTGITFYDANKKLDPTCPTGSAFPSSYDGDLFVALHGSISRTPPSGYTVIRIPMNPTTGLPLPGSPIEFFKSNVHHIHNILNGLVAFDQQM